MCFLDCLKGICLFCICTSTLSQWLGVGCISYHTQRMWSRGSGTRTVQEATCLWESAVKQTLMHLPPCPSSFPVWVLKKLQWHVTLSEALAVQRSEVAAKIGISLENKLSSFWESWRRVGESSSKALGVMDNHPCVVSDRVWSIPVPSLNCM